MEVTELCINLMVEILLLLMAQDHKYCAYAEKSQGAHLHVHPNKLQFFEYDSISLNCTGFHGSTEWRVIKKLASNRTKWEISTRNLDIKPAIISDSGEYWCENEDGEKSKAVTITVTSGDVVLEIPAFPVMEGDDVTLSCRKKGISSHLPADFYKDGHYIETGSAGKMTIHNVSKSNKGLYRCIFSQSQGKSSESCLAVRGQSNKPSLRPAGTAVLLLAVCIILPVAVPVMVGLFYCQDHTVASFSSVMTVIVYENVQVHDLHMTTNDTKYKKKRG